MPLQASYGRALSSFSVAQGVRALRRNKFRGPMPAVRTLWVWIAILAAVLGAGAARAEERMLTLRQAEETALAKHPQISAADLLALAAKQVVRETRSAYFPTVTANVTAVGAGDDNTRITAGGLNNPLILDREAQGINISQLITDFGRRANLHDTSKQRSKAEQENALATRAQILLEVNSAYFDALQAQSVLGVARQTVETRQLLFDQVSELARNNLKSELDASFAGVNLEEGKLLLAKAQNDLQASFAVLSNLLGERTQQSYRLVDEPEPAVETRDTNSLVELALKQRPDLAQLRYQRDAATSFARAEHDLRYPTISAVATGGLSPVRDPRLNQNYAAAGVNISIPIFDGMLISARGQEARLKAEAVEKEVENAENNAIRDVRVATLNLHYAGERMDLTAKLVVNARSAFDLAQAKYKVGSSSIVELSQVQLSQTEAEIAQAKARYEYRMRGAILDFQTGQMR
jgi:outer membrane protein